MVFSAPRLTLPALATPPRFAPAESDSHMTQLTLRRVLQGVSRLFELRPTRFHERFRQTLSGLQMRTFTAVIERDHETGMYVGYIPGWPRAHSQGETLDELRANLREVVDLLLEDGTPQLDAEFVGTQTLEVA
jgi:predicted RNase H-like HicB family nuclease